MVSTFLQFYLSSLASHSCTTLIMFIKLFPYAPLFPHNHFKSWFYSVLNDFTGFVSAALIVRILNNKRAIINMLRPQAANTHQLILVR